MGSISYSKDVTDVLGQLTLEEKVSLLGAVDWWRTPQIDRDEVFVPHIKATDGPNGARGESYVSGIKAACFPCGTSMGASFDTELLYRIGQGVAEETISKAASYLLAPTLNVIRSPLGGRNYETFSEDPLVLGRLAAAFVNGCQSRGIAATPKHFVANEAENQRTTVSVEVDEQTLREIYLLPFQLVMKHSDPWCFMTSYNKVNGRYVSDSLRLVDEVLRKEWGFKGTVVSDWMGVYSTVDSIKAGVDLEMPGPPKYRGQLLVDAVKKGLVSKKTIDVSAQRMLELAKRLGRFDDPYEPPERAVDDPERDEFIAEAAAEGMVLLKNNDLLPIRPATSVALIGHHALNVSLGGGGSARVDALHAITPFEGMEKAGYNVKVNGGVPVFGALPHAKSEFIFETGGQACANPIKVEWFNGDVIGQNLAHSEMRPNAEYMIKEQWPSYLQKRFCTRMTFDLVSPSSGHHIFSVISTGRSICKINGQVAYVREQEVDLRPESFYFFKSKLERRFVQVLDAGIRYTIQLESWATPEDILQAPPLNGRMFQGSALRFHEEINIPQCISSAVDLARECEVAVVCVGTTNEIESEGFDREDMELSCNQYDLIEAVAAANPKTCIVNFSGGAINLVPFIDTVPAMIQAWFPGQECGHSIARILSGKTNPSGRLPFSWPKRLEDNSSHGNFPAQNNILRYEEGLDVGYRWYDRNDTPQPLFPFGYGLSYTTFKVTSVTCSSVMTDEKAEVTFVVENTGSKAGRTVVQIYVQSPPSNIGRVRPAKELKAFEKIGLEPGEKVTKTITLDKYAVSIYDAENACWLASEGKYIVQVGLSCQDIEATAGFELQESFSWTGI